MSRDYLKVYMAETAEYKDPEVYDRAWDALPGFRRERAERYKNEESRLECVAAFALLIRGLKEIGIDTDIPGVWDELDYRLTDTEKPYFAGRPDIHFSLSHTKGAVMCVLSGQKCGCDIERNRSFKSMASVARRFFSPDEAEEIEADPGSFFRIWTRKEAYVKYTGRGISQIAEDITAERDDVVFSSIDYGNYVAAVCCEDIGI